MCLMTGKPFSYRRSSGRKNSSQVCDCYSHMSISLFLNTRRWRNSVVENLRLGASFKTFSSILRCSCCQIQHVMAREPFLVFCNYLIVCFTCCKELNHSTVNKLQLLWTILTEGNACKLLFYCYRKKLKKFEWFLLVLHVILYQQTTEKPLQSLVLLSVSCLSADCYIHLDYLSNLDSDFTRQI